MPGFLPGDIVQPDPGLSHLKALASIVRMIESCPDGFEITIRPYGTGIGGWSITRLPIEEHTFSTEKAVPAFPQPRTLMLAADVLDAEIARREQGDEMWRHH